MTIAEGYASIQSPASPTLTTMFARLSVETLRVTRDTGFRDKYLVGISPVSEYLLHDTRSNSASFLLTSRLY